MNPIQKEIFKSIDIITDKKISDLELDKTIIATIIAHPTASENLYRILYQGLKYDAYSSTNELYAVNDSVLVLVPDNQFSNKKIILMKEPKVAEALVTASGGSTGTSTIGVTQVSVVSANGFAGTVANSSSTASITLTTTINGILRGNGTAISAATVTGTGSIVLDNGATMSTTSFIGQIISTVATGVAPLSVSSTTKIINLNADYLDGSSSEYYLDYNNLTNKPTIGTVNDGALTMSTTGLGISGAASFSANTTSNVTFTITSNATSSNLVSTIVARDAGGGFSSSMITASSFIITKELISGNTIRQFGGGYNATHTANTLYELATLDLQSNNSNFTILGEVGIASGQNTAIARFILGIRGNTLPAKAFRFLKHQIIGIGQNLDIKVYEDTASNIIKIGYISTGAPQNVHWTLKVAERANYDDLTQSTSLTILDTTGLTEIVETSNTGTSSISMASLGLDLYNTKTTGINFGGSATAINMGISGGTVSVAGNLSSNQLVSTVAIGTAPLVVTSTTKVTNLNADYLDGSSSEYYLNYTNLINTPTIGNGNLTMSTAGLGISGSANFSANTTSNVTFSITSNATSSNVASTIMARTAQGSFSATDMNLSGQGLFAPGGVGTPSISFSNDSNTGLYNVAADNIAFVNGGSEKARLNSNGQFLLGLTSIGSVGNSLLYTSQGATVFNDGSTAPFFQTYHGSASTDLKTWRHGGDSSGNYQFQTVNDTYSSANNRVTFYNTGEVGIGTTTPLTSLHVNKNSGTPGYTIITGANLIITGADTVANVLELDAFAGVSQLIGRRANTTLTSPTAVAGNNNVLILAGRAYNGTAYPTTDGARIAFNTNGAQTTTASAQNIIFSNTNAGTTSLAEAMRITGPGELLIGYTTTNTTATSFKLQVNSQIFATSGTIATSDGNYKKDIESLDGSLELVKSLNPVSFNWKPHPTHNFDLNTPTIGFIAQEVQEVFRDKPYVNSIIKQNQTTYYDENGQEINEPFLGIAEGNLIAILTRAIQEQQEQIEKLKSDIIELKSMVQ